MTDKTWAIILAAGKGRRFGQAKQYIMWRDRPLYWHSALTFAASNQVAGLVFVFPETDVETEKANIQKLAAYDHLGLPWLVCAGGAERFQSAANALAITPYDCAKIAIHDAARPFLTASLIRRLQMALTPEWAGVIPGVALTDTIKLVAGEEVCQTLPRSQLRAIQTPQIFYADALREAHSLNQNLNATDDASLLESLGYKIKIVAGDAENLKITMPEDLKYLIQEPSFYPCNGFGYDAHRYGEGRPLKLGGIVIPCNYEIIAHSDGDVILHALMDALLGCACLGDIGKYFPDNDPAFEAISSAVLLDQTLDLVREAKVKICQADITLVAQKPKISPWREDIRNNIARLLNLPKNCVNFKATTEEGMGFTGNMEGVKAYALVSAIRNIS